MSGQVGCTVGLPFGSSATRQIVRLSGSDLQLLEWRPIPGIDLDLTSAENQGRSTLSFGRKAHHSGYFGGQESPYGAWTIDDKPF